MKLPSNKTFVSTDVVPIVNHAWPNTLGNRVFAKKAIAERGWGPLNYILLDDDRLMTYNGKKEITINNVRNVDISTINRNGEIFNHTLDLLIDERDKSIGRKRKHEEQKKLHSSKKEKIETISTMMGISSGKLAVENIFCLTNEDLLLKAKQIDNDKQKQTRERAVRAENSKQKEKMKFKNAAINFFSNKNLLRNDLYVLLKHLQQDGDSPVQTKVVDMKRQFDARKYRMEQYRWCDTGDTEPGNKSINDIRTDLFPITTSEAPLFTFSDHYIDQQSTGKESVVDNNNNNDNGDNLFFDAFSFPPNSTATTDTPFESSNNDRRVIVNDTTCNVNDNFKNNENGTVRNDDDDENESFMHFLKTINKK
jgi:hypothetical protein